jgi:polyisoprenoid-binding protein YceI
MGCCRAAAALALALLAARPAGAADYRIDMNRSHAEFGVRLLWLRQISGRFEQIAGEVSLNRARDSAVVDARIAVGSVIMSSERFRRWVLAPEFFDVEQHPTIHFVSEPIPLTALGQGGELHGWLTLRGITRPARFELQAAHCRPEAPEQCVLEVHGRIKRSDFGMDSHSTAISDRVELGMTVTLEHASN